MYDDYEDDAQAAAILPRGFAIVVSDDHPARRRLAREVYQGLIAHIGAGISAYGLPNVPGRKAMMVYTSAEKAERASVVVPQLIAEDPLRSQKVIAYTNNVGEPLGLGGVDKEEEKAVIHSMANYGVIGLECPDLISNLPLNDPSDRMMACGYLASLSQRAETTIVTSMICNDLDTHLEGRIWGLPELVHTRWSAHILPTDDENEHQIRIITSARLVAQTTLEETITGFRGVGTA